MNNKIKFKLSEINQTTKLITREISNFSVILLRGELGSGKTTIVSSILKELGVTENITSPTFSIVNQYKISGKKINHFDLYRVKSELELDVIGFDEYFDDFSISFIEWPEIAINRIYENYLDIYIKFIDDTTREITLKKSI
tara:strand:+ start:4622 stop:5044 length:423 start_codon:yes stop_codon:yes gene_type:complete